MLIILNKSTGIWCSPRMTCKYKKKVIVALYVHLNTLCIRHVWTTIINFLYVRVNHHPCHWCRDADVKKKVYFLKSKDLCLRTSKMQKMFEKVTMGNKRVGCSQVLLIACSWLTDHEQVWALEVIQMCFNTISKKKTKSNDLRGATSAANHCAVGKTISRKHSRQFPISHSKFTQALDYAMLRNCREKASSLRNNMAGQPGVMIWIQPQNQPPLSHWVGRELFCILKYRDKSEATWLTVIAWMKLGHAKE